MDINAVVDYLATLLNRPLTADTPLRLSSAQRARLNAWLHERGVAGNDAVLAREFTLAELMTGSRSTASAAATATAMSAPQGSSASPANLSVGIDIQSIEELVAGIDLNDLKGDAGLAGLFTARELSYAQAKSEPAQTLAGLFAAKEAVRKCMGGATLPQEAFRAIEILPDEHGKPATAGYSLSISHSAGFAIAMAVAAQGPGTPEPDAAFASASTPAAAPVGHGTGKGWTIALVTTALVLISLHVVLLVRLFG